MTREQLAHVLRAAAKIANDPEILVIGSQAILASHQETELPEVAWVSVEADLAFFNESPEPTKADRVDGAIGELSQFHETFSWLTSKRSGTAPLSSVASLHRYGDK
jgi:hypothetical protein